MTTMTEIMNLRKERKLRGDISLNMADNIFTFDGESYASDFQESLEMYKTYLELNFTTDEQDDLLSEISKILKNDETPYLKLGKETEEDKYYLISEYFDGCWGADDPTDCYKQMLEFVIDMRG